MATQNLNINANQAAQALNQINQIIQDINTSQNSVTQASQETTQAQESMFDTMKKGGKFLIENYMNVSKIIGDVVGVIDEAYTRQSKYNALLNHPNYKKYEEQLKSITASHSSLINVYQNSDTFQKLFNSNVDLSKGKLKTLTEISDSYAKAMGVDATEALQRFTEAIAEASTGKLEDLGIYLDTDTVLTQYAISLGKAKDELTKTEEKQAVLNAVLQKGKSSFEGMENPTQEFSKNIKEAQQNIDELIMTAADLGAGFLNQLYRDYEIIGGYIYDVVHIFDKQTETIKGDVVPSVLALSNAYSFLAKNITDTAAAVKNIGLSGITTFSGIVANNIKAIETTQKKYDEAAEKRHQKIVEEMNLWKEANKIKQDSEKIIAEAEIRAAGKRNNAKREQIIREVENEKKVTEEKIKAKAYMEDLLKGEKQLEIDLAKEKNDILKDYNQDKIFQMEITADELKKISALELKERIKNEKEYYDTANRMAEIGLQASANFTNTLINDVLLGEKEFRASMIADFVKGIGLQMVADGTFHIFAGIAKAWGGNPLGWKESKAGAVEAAVGIGLAGGSAPFASSSGGGETSRKETASADRQKTSSKNTDTMGVYLYPDEKYWLRALNKGNKKIGGK